MKRPLGAVIVSVLAVASHQGSIVAQTKFLDGEWGSVLNWAQFFNKELGVDAIRDAERIIQRVKAEVRGL